MKRASNSYRLQMIKEVATRQQRLKGTDQMASYIQHLLDDQRHDAKTNEFNHRFSGCHFDEHAGGWVSDHWGLK